MNTLIRGLGLGVVLCLVFILPGCSTDNDTEASRLQAGAGAVPAPEKGATGEVGPPAKSMEDYAKQQQQNNMYSKGSYPGAPKGGAPATKK